MTTAAISTKDRPRWEGTPLLRWLLRRNLPWMGLVFALSFLVLIIPYLYFLFFDWSALRETLTAPNVTPARIHAGVLPMIQLCWLLTAAALLIALSQTRWLRSKRAAELWHSFPVRRDTLLLANFGAAWLTAALPLTASYLLALAIGAVRLAMKRPEADYFILPVGEIFLDLFGWLGIIGACIAIVFLVSVATGRLVEMVLFGAVLFLGPPAAVLAVSSAMQRFLVGGWFGSLDIGYASPLFAMIERYDSYNSFWGTYSALGNWMLLLWACVGLLCLWLACRCFRTRPAEQSGAGGVREPVGTLGVLLGVFAAGLGLGEFLWYQFTLESFVLATLCCALGLALLLLFLLNGGRRGFGKRLPLLAACVLLPVAAALAVTTGGLGYEDYIPSPSAAPWVQIRYRGRYGVLAKRLDHEREDAGTMLYTDDGPMMLITTPLDEVPEVSRSMSYSYGELQRVTLSTPEGRRAAEDLHRSLIRTQQMEPEGRRSMGGHIDFIYADGTHRIYGQWLGGNHVYDCRRDTEALLALEENPEFRQQTDPRFTVTPEEVRAIRVSDVTGLTTGEPITGRAEIERLLAAMKADAEAFDYTAFREGTARAAAYLSVETIAPAPGQPVREPIGKDLWQSFCLPVYGTDKNTLDALWATGQGEKTGRFLSRDKITGVEVRWWGNASFTEEVYWTGTGPRDLMADVRAERSSSAASEDHSTLTVTEPAAVAELLELTLGADCHVSEEGFLVTVLGAEGRGCTFWLSREDAPQVVLDWYEAYKKELRSSLNVWQQRMEP